MARSAPASLRSQALLEFGLPAAPPRLEELGPLLGRGEALRVVAPGGVSLLLLSCEQPLQLAFEAALFDLLAESRFPAPRPRRSSSGSLIAKLDWDQGAAAAACYPWPAGEALEPRDAQAPQFLELGRLLARLHQL